MCMATGQDQQNAGLDNKDPQLANNIKNVHEVLEVGVPVFQIGLGAIWPSAKANAMLACCRGMHATWS
jgi:hypothetical protein